MQTKKLKAFTLMELSIAMLIAAICIGMAFYMFQFFQRLYLSQQREKQEQFSFSLFQHLLKKDMDQAQAVFYAENELQLLDSAGTIRYIFTENHIARDHYQQQTDTFNFKISAIDGLYRNASRPSPTCIDEFQVTVTYGKEEHTFILDKKYAAQQLMQIANTKQD